MITKLLGLPHIRGASIFITAMFVDALGSGLFVPFSLLYFHTVAVFSLQVVGIVLTAATILSIPMTLVTGILIDRFGARRIIIISELLLAAGFSGYLVVHTVPMLFATAFLATAGDRMFWVAQPTLIAEIADPGEQDRWYGLVGSIRMAGLGLGGVLAGLLISFGSVFDYQILAGADALSFLVVIALLLPYLRARHQRNRMQQSISGYGVVLKDRPFLGLVVSNVAFILCIFMLTSAMPVYVIEALQAPAWMVGVLLGLNTILTGGGQMFIVRLLEKRWRTRVLVGAGLIWCGSCGLLALALIVPHFLLVPYLIIVIIIYTLAGLMHAPTANALVAEVGPTNVRGRYVAAYQLSWGIGMALTPALFTLLFTRGPALPWVVLAGLALITALIIKKIGRRLPERAVRVNIETIQHS